MDSKDAMKAILGYCKAHNIPCWITWIKPEVAHFPYPGVSSELMALGTHEAIIRHANGDRRTVPLEQITISH